MKTIKLTQGKETIIDDKDFEHVSMHKWYAHYDGYNWYAKRQRTIRYNPREQTAERLHRFLLSPNKDQEIDHINGDTLDNRRCNLRICTRTENMRNSKKPITGLTSKYKGVDWDKHNKKFRARIRIDEKRKCLGYFKDEVKAALAYDSAALEHHGEFARFNFPIINPNGTFSIR